MGLYLYAIARASDEDGPSINNEDIFVQTVGKLAALVREVPYDDVPHAETEAVLDHAKILNSWNREAALIPVSFGTIFNDGEELSSFLDEHENELLDQLEHLRGKVEIGIKASWREEAVMDLIAQENLPEAAIDGDGVSGDVEMGRETRATLNQHNYASAEHILDHLVRHAEDHIIKEPEGERMMLNANFLVDKERIADFDAELEELDEHYEDRILFQYTGPVLPYHFVKIEGR